MRAVSDCRCEYIDVASVGHFQPFTQYFDAHRKVACGYISVFDTCKTPL